MQQVALTAVPSQTLSVVLAGQACQLAVYQRRTGLFFDCLLNGIAVVTGVLCQNLVRLITQSYSGFIGDFYFFDTQGDTAPVYTGFGSPTAPGRYQLIYLEAADL
jgi:hypothetical protein